MTYRRHIGLATLFALSQSAIAQETPPPIPCSEPEYRQMDFWVGDWDISWDDGQGGKATGTNTITQAPFGDCVITENFNGGTGPSALKGLSVSTFSKPHGVWRQTWVDNQGGYFALVGGPQADGTFVLDMVRLGDKGPYRRMVFEDITADSLTWRWQGRMTPEEDWTDQWVLDYKKKT